MNIYLENIKLSEQKAGGVTGYWYELVKRLLKSHKDTYVVEHKSASSINLYRSQLNIDKSRIIHEAQIPVKILRYLPIAAKMEEQSLLHSGYYRVSLRKNVVNIITVYDFIYEYYRKGLPRLVHSLQKDFAIARADGIICISHNTKKDLLKFHPTIDEKKVKVICLGVSEDFHPIEDKEKSSEDWGDITKEQFILYVGGRKGYKNFNIAVDAVHKMDNFKLVFVGGGPLSVEERAVLTGKLKNRYQHVTGVDNVKLNFLYNHAFCLIYPSSYEGFGIPILEAMRAGCPVITTNLSSIPEVCGNAGLMVNNLDPNEIILKLRLLADDLFRLNVIKLGFEQSKKFSWDTTFRETLDFYHEIYRKTIK